MTEQSQADVNPPRVLILGAGFGGLRVLRNLTDQPVQATLVDRNNYHLFQPLLYQVATAGLSTDEIAYPVRGIMRKGHNTRFWLGEVTGIDLDARKVTTSTGVLDYDYLVIGLGSANNFFGMQSMEENSLTLKTIRDAVSVRNRLLRQFERASRETDPEKRRAMLTFVVVGGGPTGVECAGAISELFRRVLRKDFPNINIREEVRVILVEGLPRLLSAMPENLSQFTAETLRRKRVDVRLNSLVAGYDGEVLTFKDGESLPTQTVIWAAGVRANPLLDTLGLPQDKMKRIIVTPTLQVATRPEVLVIGDSASLQGPDGQPLPMVAPVAIQQAERAAKNILLLAQGAVPGAFQYKDPGMLATIGRSKAVAQIGGFKLKGFFAWLVWLVVHIMQLIGFRNRLVVLVDWAWQYIFYDRPLRLIEEPGDRRTY